MKKSIICLMVMGIVLAGSLPVLAEEEMGEVVSQAAPTGPSMVIPPGEYGIVAKYLDQFLSTPPGGHRTIYAETLMDGINNSALADELADFYILDIRTSAEFCKDTVLGAVNIPLAELAKAESLAKLPLDRPILLICNTGHTSSIANTALGTLGYNAWTLRFGMMGWRLSSNTKVWSPSSAYSQLIYGPGYPVQICK